VLIAAEDAMRVQDVMSEQVKTVPGASGAEEAWQLMRGDRIHHLVVTERGRVAGVLSAADTGGARGAALRKGRTVSELMTDRVIAVDKNVTVKRAANLMRGHSIGCLVVTERDRPVGIVTTSDLLELLGRGAIRPTPTGKRPALNFRAPHRKRSRAYGVW
jgi:CBS domain-containing protein